jgi:hypothetical protein
MIFDSEALFRGDRSLLSREIIETMLIMTVGTAADRQGNPPPCSSNVPNTTLGFQPSVVHARRLYPRGDFLQGSFRIQVPLSQRLRLISSRPTWTIKKR